MHRIRTIHDSLAIEGNTLSLEQMTTVLEGKRVVGPERDIIEVRNANKAYDELSKLNPYKVESFLKAHGILMKGLIESAGRFRSRSVGIADARGNVSHIAPPASNVPALVTDLFAFAKRTNPPLSALIRAAIVHYELEFIHPFEDGNGRIGRLWHTLLLTRYHSAFEFVPMESVIHHRQEEYYRALAASDGVGKSTPFVEFALSVTEDGLSTLLDDLVSSPVTPERRIETAAAIFRGRDFSRKDYMNQFPGLSSASASRDLNRGVQSGVFTKKGEKSLTRYRVVD